MISARELVTLLEAEFFPSSSSIPSKVLSAPFCGHSEKGEYDYARGLPGLK